MSQKTIFPFLNPVNYTPDPTVEISNGARLKLIDLISQVFTQTFDSDIGFTYDNTKTEFISGVARQKDQAPTNSVTWATYTSITNLNYVASGSATATLTGSPSINDGKFECLGGDNENAIYNNTNIATIQNAGAMKLKWTAGYNGSPAANINIIQLGNSSNPSKLILMHHTNGFLRISAWDSGGANIHLIAQIAAFVPVSGTAYEFEVNFTASTGIIELYLDGVFQGATPITAFTRAGTNYLYVGSGTTYIIADGAYEDAIIFDVVQHSGGSGGNYTSGYVLQEAKYLEDLITLPSFIYSGPGSVQAFTSFVTVLIGAVKFNINGLYYSGGWIVSDDTYVKMNTTAEILANIASLPTTDTIIIKARTQNINTQMSMDNLILSYTGQIYPVTNPILTTNSSIEHDSLENFVETVMASGGDSIKYNLSKGNTFYWWNGSAWVEANGTFAQSNTAAEILANVASFTSLKVFMRIKLFFHSNSGSTTPEITLLTITSSFSGAVDVLAKIVVWGNLYAEDAVAKVQTITARLNRELTEYKNYSQIRSKGVTTMVKSDGSWEMELIETDNMEAEAHYNFSFNDNIYARKVPAALATINFNELPIV